MKIRTLAIVPAKGTSRRLPRKNKKMLAGKPLFLHTVDAAKRGGIDEILVTSDDFEILAIAQFSGARAVRRPAELAGDFPDLQAVKRHAIAQLDVRIFAAFDALFMLLPTYPFRRADDIATAIDLLATGKLRTVQSGTIIERCGGLFLPNSYLSATLTEAGISRLGGPPDITATMPIDRVRGIDIDDPADWARAEFQIGKLCFCTAKQSSNNATSNPRKTFGDSDKLGSFTP